MDRSAAYDFLLTFHSNHGQCLTVSEINGNFSRKSQIFPTHPVYIAHPLTGFPLEFGTGTHGQKTSDGATVLKKEA